MFSATAGEQETNSRTGSERNQHRPARIVATVGHRPLVCVIQHLGRFTVGLRDGFFGLGICLCTAVGEIFGRATNIRPARAL